MTPEEKTVIDGMFERLKSAESQQRDVETERYIADLIRQQPYAPYTLAQSVYVQEQALLNQQAEIERLKAENVRLQQKPQGGGFFSGIFGGSVPNAGARQQPYQQPAQQAYAPQPSPWGQPQGMQPQAMGAQRGGMGFLGTAAAAAAGVAGGMMLGNVLSSAFGGGQAHAAPAQNVFTPSPAETMQTDASALDEEQSFDPGMGDYDSGYDGGAESYDA